MAETKKRTAANSKKKEGKTKTIARVKPEAGTAPASPAPAGAMTVMVPLDQIAVMEGGQVRKHFDEAKLRELAENIREHGVIQPIVLNQVHREDGKLELIAGERRWRAARLAGLSEIPAQIREMSRQAALEIQLLENLQREDLTVIEEANGMVALMQRCGYTQEQLAERLSKSQGYVSEMLGLVKLPPVVQKALNDGILSTRAATALRRILPADGTAPGDVAIRVAEELVADGVPAAKAVGFIKERARFHACELNPNAPSWSYKRPPQFDVAGCQGCPYRVEGKVLDHPSPLCLNSKCWEQKQEAVARQKRRMELQRERLVARRKVEETYRSRLRGMLWLASHAGTVLGPAREQGVDVPSHVQVGWLAHCIMEATEQAVKGDSVWAVRQYRRLCKRLGVSDQPGELNDALRLDRKIALHNHFYPDVARRLAAYLVSKATGEWPDLSAPPAEEDKVTLPVTSTEPSTPDAPAATAVTAPAAADMPEAENPQQPTPEPAPPVRQQVAQKPAMEIPSDLLAVVARLRAKAQKAWDERFSADLARISNPEEDILFEVESVLSLEDLVQHFDDRVGLGATSMPKQFGGAHSTWTTSLPHVSIPTEGSYWMSSEDPNTGLLRVSEDATEIRMENGRVVDDKPSAPVYVKMLAFYRGSGMWTIYQVAAIAFPKRDVIITGCPQATLAKPLRKGWLSLVSLLPAVPEIPAEMQGSPEAPAGTPEDMEEGTNEQGRSGQPDTVEEEGEARAELLSEIGAMLRQLAERGSESTDRTESDVLNEAQLREALTQYWTTGVLDVIREVLKRNGLPISGNRATVENRIKTFLATCTREQLLEVYAQGDYVSKPFQFRAAVNDEAVAV